MILALDCDDVVDVILRTQKLPQITRVHLGRSLQVVAGDCPHYWFATRLIGSVEMRLMHHMSGVLLSVVIADLIRCGLVAAVV